MTKACLEREGLERVGVCQVGGETTYESERTVMSRDMRHETEKCEER